MIRRMLSLLMLASVVACSPPERPAPQQLTLYAASTEVRLFADAVGFEFPEGVSLEQILDRQSGALLTQEEVAAVSRSVSVVPPPDEVAMCAHFWRHVFVFYDANGSPLGALAYCMECGAVSVIGPEDPDVGLERLRYDGARLSQIVEAHGLAVEPEYPE